MAVSAFLNKGVLLKGSSLLTGVIGVASGGSSGFGSSKYNINSISKINFTKDEELHKLFKDGRCIQKHLPGEIENISEKKIQNGSHLGAASVSTDGFSGVGRIYDGFKGTKGCIDAKIKWSDKEQNKGIIGYVELVIWNDTSRMWDKNKKQENIKDNGYAMIMRTIISGLEKDLRFLNQLTTLREDLGNWKIQNSFIWFDSASTVSGDKKIKLKYGDLQIFEIDWKSSEKPIDPNSLENKYEKLALWKQGEKDTHNEKLLGNLSIEIKDKNTDLWTTMDKMLQEDKKQNTDFAAKLFCTGENWYTISKFPKDHKFFRNFDTYNPGWKGETNKTQENIKNHMSIYGKWSD